MAEISTDGIQIGSASSSSRTSDQATVIDTARPGVAAAGFEAAVILIAHPENRRLGTRFRVTPGSTLEIGRSQESQISLPEVPSLSRVHARIRFAEGLVSLEDLGSRNGTFVNDRATKGSIELRSGDRFQVGAVHFKFLHERDVEHAYYEAIHEMVVRDGLTGVHNRRKFIEEATREVARALRYKRELALILIDIDHFKAVNDTHGHLAGDAALKQLAVRFSSQVRAEEVFARIGGEEFAVLCPETDLEGATALAEKLRAACERKPFDCAGIEVGVTCSFGVAQLGGEMSKLDDLIRAADRALYRAKSEGRNRVSAAAPA
jgi:diguanylate cyclase (GGDEF)-like protein